MISREKNMKNKTYKHISAKIWYSSGARNWDRRHGNKYGTMDMLFGNCDLFYLRFLRKIQEIFVKFRFFVIKICST